MTWGLASALTALGFVKAGSVQVVPVLGAWLRPVHLVGAKYLPGARARSVAVAATGEHSVVLARSVREAMDVHRLRVDAVDGPRLAAWQEVPGPLHRAHPPGPDLDARWTDLMAAAFVLVWGLLMLLPGPGVAIGVGTGLVGVLAVSSQPSSPLVVSMSVVYFGSIVFLDGVFGDAPGWWAVAGAVSAFVVARVALGLLGGLTLRRRGLVIPPLVGPGEVR